MKIKWKNNKKLKPQIILDKIDEAKSIKDGKVSYSAFDYHDSYVALFSMLEVPTSIQNDINLERLLSGSLSEVALDGKITKDTFIKKININLQKELSKKEIKYHLLTSISIYGDIPFKSKEIFGARIRFISEYPRKFSSRDKLINDMGDKFIESHNGYVKVIVSLKAKSPQIGFSKGMKALDQLRALLNLFVNPNLELFGDKLLPINRIRLGQVHTMHKENGNGATDKTIWFEPNFILAKPYQFKNLDTLKHNLFWALDKLSQSSYDKIIKNSLVRYVRSLDESDHNNGLIKIWGAIESLAAPKEANYDKIVKRCSFLFKEAKYHAQLLEHLREYRNESIHAGDQSERAKTNCFQLQYYYVQLVIFHLKHVDEFSNLQEANSFLDLPDCEIALEQKRKLVKLAFDYREMDS